MEEEGQRWYMLDCGGYVRVEGIFRLWRVC